MIITRFAPSPTGELHIGSVRTALFAYLFAKNQNGKFYLRIEDTDRERFVEGSVERIIESLKWLGIDHDNSKPMVQSARLSMYRKIAFDLVKANKAYICTCSKEQLARAREKQISEGNPPMYDGSCRQTGIEPKDVEGREFTIRMKMPTSGKIVIHDLIRGDVEFDLSLMDDQIILKSDGYPTYHLASVVDDHEMEVTHVIRAEEWLSSTPKHLVLYQMLGWDAPKFAHLSMILGPDKKKLSKRHGATSTLEYRRQGYLPEALVNFMVFLGWNPKDEREEFTLSELIKEFRIENLHKAPAVFDVNKLRNINEQYIKKADPTKLKLILEDEFGLSDLKENEMLLIQRGGYFTLKESADYLHKLLQEPSYKAELLIFKKSTKGNTIKGLESSVTQLETINESKWDSHALQDILSAVVQKNNLTNGDVFWPLRVALSGEEKSPSPVELLLALGKNESLHRLKIAINFLN